MVVGKTDFLLQKRQLSQTWKVYWNLYWISVYLVYGRSLGEQFQQSYFDLIEVVFLGLKIDKYTLLQQLYFLHLIQYLLQFSTYKNLTYIKFLQMLRRFCRTKQFIDSCSTSRVRRSNVSPLFLHHLLNLTGYFKQHWKHFNFLSIRGFESKTSKWLGVA